jgi:hypothetical protein
MAPIATNMRFFHGDCGFTLAPIRFPQQSLVPRRRTTVHFIMQLQPHHEANGRTQKNRKCDKDVHQRFEVGRSRNVSLRQLGTNAMKSPAVESWGAPCTAGATLVSVSEC